MARKGRKRQSGGSRGPSAISRLFADRRRLSRYISTALTVIILIALIVILTLGRSNLRARADAVRHEPVRVAFEWPPLANAGEDGRETWLDSDSRERLENLARAILSDSFFDHDSLAKLQEELEKTGWFTRPPVVRREPGGVVSVRGQWRVPAAVVRYRSQDRLVSRRGELLEPRYEPDRSGLKVILGPSRPPPDRLGEEWIGGDVRAGLDLLAYLRDTPGYEQIHGVDVSEYSRGSRRQLTLVTDAGTRILWGGPPDEFVPGEASAEIKKRRLAELHRRHGRIDAGRPMLDIRLEHLIIDNTATSSPDP